MAMESERDLDDVFKGFKDLPSGKLAKLLKRPPLQLIFTVVIFHT